MSRNPLFIGNAFATKHAPRHLVRTKGVAIPYSSGMFLLRGWATARLTLERVLSQSPIHRECFCYPRLLESMGRP